MSIMSSEKVLIISGAIGIATVLSVLIAFVATYNMDMNAKMESAIKAGNNPMDVYCAFNGSSESKACLVRAAVKGESK